MTQSEIEKVADFMKQKTFATKEELLDLIIRNNSMRKPEYFRFFLIDLFRANVLFKYDEKRYKYTGALRLFKYEYTDSDKEIIAKIESRIDEAKICVWNTSVLTPYMDLMPYWHLTFVETEKPLQVLLYDTLENEGFRVICESEKKDIERFSSVESLVILKKLITRAPLDDTYENLIGKNTLTKRERKPVVLKPKAEKILVDIFAESDRFGIFSEYDSIFRGFLKTYCINFQKLFYYAKNRGICDKIDRFLREDIRFDVKTGDFR